MEGAESAGDWRSKVPVSVLYVILIFLPVLLLLSHRNTVTALAITGLAAAFYPGALKALRKLMQLRTFTDTTPQSILAWLLLFCLFVFFSLLWSEIPGRAGWIPRLLLFVLASAAMVWLAGSIEGRLAIRAVWLYLMAVLIGALLLGVEGISGGMLRDIIPPDGLPDKDLIASARGVGLLLYLAIPAILFLQVEGAVRHRLGDRFCRILQVSILAGATAGVLFLGISANLIAYLGALLAALIGYWRPGVALGLLYWGMIGAFCLFLGVAALLPPIDQLAAIEFVPASWLLRLIAWRHAADLILADFGSFLIGGGLGYSRYLMDAGPLVQLPVHPFTFPVIPTHPHNLFLQIWLEFGLIGVTLVAAAIAQTRSLLRQWVFSNTEVAAVCSLGAVFFIFASVEINLWSLWRFTGLIFAIFGLVLIRRLDS